MDIAFVEPRANFEGFSFGFHEKLPLIGPLYLATFLKNLGYKVSYFKESLKNFNIEKIKADFLCITAMTSTAKRAYEICRIFKKNNPDSKVVLGGVHPTFMQNEALKYADYVVLGEAEDIIKDIVEGKYKKGIIYGSKTENLDELPFPDLNLISSNIKVAPVSTSRGCPYNCTFCSVTEMFGRKFRFRSPESIIEELKGIKSKEIFFYDDNFCADKERAKTILKLMIENKINKSWWSQTRVDVAKDEELLKLMSETNCNKLVIGLESVNPKTLELYNKHQELRDIENCIKKLHDYNIKIYGMFVLGSDFDTEKTIDETFDFCRKLDIDIPQFSALTPLPGTKIFNQFEKENRLLTKDWDFYDFVHVVYKPKLMTAYNFQKKLFDALERAWFPIRGLKFMLQNFSSSFSILKRCSNWMRQKKEYLNQLSL